MKYRLKDQALQKRLDEVTGGNFSHRLQDNDFVERMEFKSFEEAAVTLLLLNDRLRIPHPFEERVGSSRRAKPCAKRITCSLTDAC